jgi:hypothetical protein
MASKKDNMYHNYFKVCFFNILLGHPRKYWGNNTTTNLTEEQAAKG